MNNYQSLQQVAGNKATATQGDPQDKDTINEGRVLRYAGNPMTAAALFQKQSQTNVKSIGPIIRSASKRRKGR